MGPENIEGKRGMEKKEAVTVEINGEKYSGTVIRRYPAKNPKVIDSITVTIDPRNQDCSALDEIAEGSLVTIDDKSFPGNCSGDYIYKSGNYQEIIFDSK